MFPEDPLSATERIFLAVACLCAPRDRYQEHLALVSYGNVTSIATALLSYN